MPTVTISPKFQVVIPKDIRDELSLAPGQKIQAIAYNNRIELIPVRPLRQMRGALKPTCRVRKSGYECCGFFRLARIFRQCRKRSIF